MLPPGSSWINRIGGFPHSEICGSKVAHTSPQLIAACHVLHRLYVPRHPRIALTSRLRVHTTNDNAGPAPPVSGATDTKLGRAACRGVLVWMIKSQPDYRAPSKQCFDETLLVIEAGHAPPSAEADRQLKADTITASILRTHSQCQRGPSRPVTSRRREDLVSSSSGNQEWWSLSGSNR